MDGRAGDAYMLTGGCFCGAVRYRVGAEPLYEPTLCHCRSCQRAAGAHAVAWLTLSLESLRFEQGTPAVHVSSPGVKRSFCPRCGTPLAYWNAQRAGEIDVTVCSLDDADAVTPADQIWTEDARHWEGRLARARRWPRMRGS